MPSIHPNYEYDIFISYRQNDNKRDGWVSQFVQALQDELEATLKNPVSIYFDENPHDGLLETHQVGATLEKKLKCLVFIPIISQTYCDPKSFAWAEEFLPFNKMASSDEIGMQITLSNGNVVSRILPIQIHDLDDPDRQLLEKELGGPMRSIDFIYKEPGVNRPLKPSDNKAENLNKTSYHNQINKVANALKEMGQAILSQQDPTNSVKEQAKPKSQPLKAKSGKAKTLVIAAVIVLVAVVGYFLSQNISSSSSNYDFDIAVMYFENLTDDEKYDDGLVNLIHINLAEDTSLHLVPRQKMYDALKEINNEAKTPDQTVATELASTLNVEFMVIGRIIQQGLEVIAQVELIEVASGKIVATKKIKAKKEEIFSLADEITSQLMAGRIPERNFNVTKLTTSNYDAYQYYYKGLENLWDLKLGDAIEEFRMAIEIDSTFAMAYVYKAISENMFGSIDVYKDQSTGQADMETAILYIDELSVRDQLLTKLAYQHVNLDPAYYETMAELNRLDPYDKLASLYNTWSALDKPDPLALRRQEEVILRHPNDVELYNMLAYVAAHYGEMEKAVEAVNTYREGETGIFNALHSSWEINMLVGNYQEALKYGKEIEEKYPSGKSRFFWRGLTYLFMLEPDSALAIYQHYPNSPVKGSAALGTLAFMMKGQWTSALMDIDKNINLVSNQNLPELAIFLSLAKPVVYMARGDSEAALAEIENIIDESQALSFNPYQVVAAYYRCLVYLEAGNIAQAEIESERLAKLIKEEGYDTRFDQFTELTSLEIALKKGELAGLGERITSSTYDFRRSSARMYTIKLRYLIATEQYDAALQEINDIYRYTLASRVTLGGDQNLFTLTLMYSNYYLGQIYEKKGNTAEAIKAYQAFVELLKDADIEMTAVIDAKSRLAALQ